MLRALAPILFDRQHRRHDGRWDPPRPVVSPYSSTTALHAELALAWDNRVTASTFGLGGATLPTYQEVYTQPSHILTRTMTVDGRRYLLTSTRIETNTDDGATLSVFSPLAPIDAMTHALWVLLSLLGLALCCIVILLTWRMAHAIITPFRQLVSAARRIQSGDLSACVEPRAQHEIRVPRGPGLQYDD